MSHVNTISRGKFCNDNITNEQKNVWKLALRLVHNCEPTELKLLEEALTANDWLLNYADTQGDTLLHHAARAHHIHIIEWLLGQHASVDKANRRGRQPLHEAMGDITSMHLLLDNGASANGIKHGEWTPLHLAALKGDLTSLELLLKHGADPLLAIKDGRTVLHLAAATSEQATLYLINAAPSLVPLLSQNGRLAIHMAAQAGFTQAVEALLAVAPDSLTQRDHAGTTPWLASIIGGHAALAAKLLHNHHDSNIAQVADDNGRNALHLAAMIGDQAVAKLAIEQWHLSVLQPDTWDH
ncbi:ankyrin repeat-containing domain protein [Syncephalis fuscata]|nr:ankyrin repeat-containing domain protein [Syncephalis fuscata]